ncbi:uncharacterized protein LAESUDRAFT_750535 [Laetiporus sulphureus 93-53]|uniref:Uncharacterized protein n=1 Tax=Laetiporus sulphureus 93-53 TaxID=1314785 RepID=A0A165DTP3_9APHY|nr:uncharacterized protein LAESUDRAFT_750535 [Laetiporus sulphureus 93-53]KZT05614.1 hypothetical protein LAESUDRAFT_750535 [Laetiporus sulphureus 93-53]
MSDTTDSFFDDYPDVDQRSCRLLGPTALITQGLLGVLVISSLVYKRHRETPKRPWRIWLFDVSKQVIGQLVVHGVNVLISGVVAHLSSGNACVFYFINILVDTTIGIGVIYFILHLLTWTLSEKCHLKGFESGQYGSPPSITYWARQAAVYVLSLLSMKLLVVALFAAWPGIFKLGEWLLSFLGSSDALQVIFTMGLFPIFMNVLQFWLIDSIVKSSQAAAVVLPSLTPRSSMDTDEEPLFNAPSDDESDDGNAVCPPHDIENPRPRSSSCDHMQDESKSFRSGSATIVGSGSTTPAAKPVDIALSAGRGTPVAHAYPPSLSASSSTSPASSISARTKSLSPRPKRRRRSPPPALALHTILSPAHAVPVNGTPSALTPVPQEPELADSRALDEKGWAGWGDQGVDDWAEHVGEEEWTGKRMEARKGAVDNVWTRHDSAVDSNS